MSSKTISSVENENAIHRLHPKVKVLQISSSIYRSMKGVMYNMLITLTAQKKKKKTFHRHQIEKPCSNIKSPEPDGHPVEFYQEIWHHLPTCPQNDVIIFWEKLFWNKKSSQNSWVKSQIKTKNNHLVISFYIISGTAPDKNLKSFILIFWSDHITIQIHISIKVHGYNFISTICTH